ncbi:B-cell receptor CD22 isoform X2 [Pleuronectes platessa]|uniref:B-cell receptor CD22 isoform X2 n=1 Tax=Pleuronectes platessa TaxID=8262 RepID=UPI00232A1892|nr:B-cell receptor CD22 isoform X2 [Pleuronectes platessa]
MEAQTVKWLVFLALIKHVSTSPFKLEPGGLLATEGSCVEIKCQVTRDVDDHDAYWFWMKDYTSTVIYSTNTVTRPVSPDFANRVNYIGSPSSSWQNANSAGPKPLCNILICDLRRSDSGKYSLRFEGREQWSSEEVTLSVEVNRCPLTFEGPAAVVESDVVTLTCSTSSSCPSHPQIQDVTQIDRTQVTGYHQDKERTTTFSFTASREDDGREFSCQTQDNTDKYLIRNIKVTVKYPPTEPKLSMRSEVTEGQTIAVSCTAESFPQSTLTLMKINTNPQSLKSTENSIYSQTSNSLYHTFTVTSSDAGLYFCRAQNTEGSKDSKQKKLVVKYSPKHVTVQANPGLDVKENVSLTLSCSAESNPPVSSVTWRKTTDGREEIIQQTQTQSFRVNSASPSDSGLYSCEATNDIGSGKSQPAEVKVRFSPKHTHITESSEKQELDGRSSVMLSCFSHSFPPVQHYSWYRKSQEEEKDELVSEHQNHTVYSNQPGVYYCIAQNEADQSLSDPVHLFEPTGNSLHILKFLLPALLVLMIIFLIVVVLRRRKKKSFQQGTTNRTFLIGWWNGTRRRSLTNDNVSVEPFRNRDDLLSEQLRHVLAQRHQPLPDSTPLTDINVVYSILKLPQVAPQQNPTRQQDGNTEEDSVIYASLVFKNKINNKETKVEEDSVYAKVSNPTRVKKNEPEILQDYENISNAAARAPTSPNLLDDHTSEGEVELNFPQVRFTATPRHQTTNRDSSSSHQDESLYSNVRI